MDRGALRELHLTLVPLPGETVAALGSRLDAMLEANDATVVRHEVFGPTAAWPALCRADAGRGSGWDWPVTWTEGASCAGSDIAGMHVFAVSGVPVETVFLEGRAVGRVFDDGSARHCLLGGVLPADPAAPRDVQARQVFERIEAALKSTDLSMTDVARTWLFLDDILAWYGPLNQVRRDFFAQRHLFDHLVPASTGVGVRNPAGAAMVAGAWAAEPRDDRFLAGEVLSPLQCPAPQYGSCFSRAVEMVSPDLHRLFVSGTASIEPKGTSVCADDVDGQIDLTLQVVRAILVSRGMDYPDVNRATAYLRRPGDEPLFRGWLARLGLEDWPLVVTQAVVCRDELLFEIELDALAPAAPAAPPGEP